MCLLDADAAVPFTNGVQQHGAPASLQPLAEALSKADTAAQKSEAAVPPQVHVVLLHLIEPSHDFKAHACCTALSLLHTPCTMMYVKGFFHPAILL